MDIGFISAGSGIIGLNNLTHDQIVLIVNSLNELNNLADYIIIDTGCCAPSTVLVMNLCPRRTKRIANPFIISMC